MFNRVSAFVDDVRTVAIEADLRLAVGEISRELGFAHFALVHHVDLRGASGAAIRIHNYPDEW
jgi:LuxR family quorum-sensing system transcriptional regulator CciR